MGLTFSTATSAPPVTVTVDNPVAPETITITKAAFSSRKGELKVEATSSASTGDPATSPTLQITHTDGAALDTPNDMAYNPKKDKYSATVSVSPKPNTVTVTSPLGGSATASFDW